MPSAALQNFWIQVALSYRALFLWLNWPAYVSNVFLRPIVSVLLYALIGRFALDAAAAERYALGMIALSIPWIILGGAVQTFFYERVFGTLPHLFASTANRAAVYFGRGVLHSVNGVLCALTALMFSALLLGLDLTRVHWGGAILAIGLMTLSSTAYALFAGNFAIIFREWFNVLTISTSLFLLTTGAVIPRADLPGVLQAIGALMPVSHGLVAFRVVFTGAPPPAVDLGQEGLVVLLYGAGGFALFRLLERLARRRGAYEEPT